MCIRTIALKRRYNVSSKAHQSQMFLIRLPRNSMNCIHFKYIPTVIHDSSKKKNKGEEEPNCSEAAL